MCDTLDIGPTPGEEQAAQTTSPTYWRDARIQYEVYRNLLRRTFGPEPEGTRLVIKNEHGEYLDLKVEFDSDSEVSIKYAFDCEGSGPTNWDDQARQELQRRL